MLILRLKVRRSNSKQHSVVESDNRDINLLNYLRQAVL